MSRVRTYPTPAEALASLVSEAVSGTSSRASSGYFDLESLSWRTFQLSLLEDSTLCSAILRKAGTMRSGFLYELPTLERRTFESGSSSSDGGWPTPDASVSNDGQDPESYEERRQKMRRRKYNGNGGGTPLAIAAQSAQRSLWPTPNATDYKGPSTRSEGKEREAGDDDLPTRVARVWATPTAARQSEEETPESWLARSEKARSVPLAVQAKTWPTPKASDADRGGDPKRDGGEQSGGGRRSNLVDAVMPGAKRFTAAGALWPTPVKSDGEGDPRPPDAKRGPAPGLQAAVQPPAEMWPTPTVADAGQAGDQYAGGNPTLLGRVRKWPTPTTSDATSGMKVPDGTSSTGKRPDGRATLSETVRASGGKMWPTATTSDADGSRRHGYMDEGKSGTTLTDAALAIMQDGPQDPMTPKDGRATRPRLVLNPRFVEALMGMPDRWTAMDPISFLAMRRETRRARRASKRLATQSSRSARKSSVK